MTPRPPSLHDLYWEAEQDLKADPRLGVALKWAFWHAGYAAEREVRRTRAILAGDDAVRDATLDLLQESMTGEQAAAHVLEMLRARRPKKQAAAPAVKPPAQQRSVVPARPAKAA